MEPLSTVGTFSRLNRLLQSNLRAVLDQAEDPEQLISSTLAEMRDGLKQAQRDVITAQGSAKRLAKEAEAKAGEVTQWEDRAALALRAGDEALARDALRQKLALGREADAKAEQAATAQRAADQLQAGIAQLERRRDDLEARKGVLASQVRAARTTGAGQGTAPTPGLGRLEALTDRIDALEAEVEVAAVLDDPERCRVEARFAELEAAAGGSVVEDELAALKRKVEQGS